MLGGGLYPFNSSYKGLLIGLCSNLYERDVSSSTFVRLWRELCLYHFSNEGVKLPISKGRALVNEWITQINVSLKDGYGSGLLLLCLQRTQLVQIGAFDLESPLVDVVIDGLSQTTYVESLYTLNTTTNDLRSVFVL